MKRIVAICLSLVIALCGFAMVGCSQSNPQDVIRNGITKELDAIKNMDDATIDEMVQSVPYSVAYQIESLGVDLGDYLKAYYSGFGYQIGEIKVNGDQATVDITLDVKNATEASKAIETYVASLTLDQQMEIANGLYGGTVPAWFGEGVVQTIADLPNTTTETFQVPVTKSGNTWSVDSAAEEIFAAAIAGS